MSPTHAIQYLGWAGCTVKQLLDGLCASTETSFDGFGTDCMGRKTVFRDGLRWLGNEVGREDAGAGMGRCMESFRVR